MWKLRRYLKKYSLQVFLGPFCKMIEAIFELIVPLIMIKIMDVGIPNNDSNYIWSMGAIILSLGVLGLMFSLICQYFASVASQSYGRDLRSDLFHHINTLAYEDIDALGTSSLITRITNDVYQSQTGIAMMIRLIVRSPLIVIGSIIMALLIDLKLGIIFTIVGPLISILLMVILKLITKMFKKVQKRLDRISLITRENLDGVRVIRAFSKKEKEIKRFDDANEDFIKTNLQVSKIQALLNPLTFALINIAIIFIIYFGSVRVNIGDITQGELIAFVNYMMQISVAVVAMVNLFILLSKANASSERISEIFAIKPKIVSGSITEVTPTSTIIEFRNVDLKYPSNSGDSLESIDLKIGRGEMIGIIGGTGSGKTSLINLIPRFYDATNGEVLVNGVNVKEYNLDTLRSLVAVVPQKSVLYSGTIASNLRWGKKDATDEEMHRALKIAQAEEFVMAKVDQLNSRVEQEGENFSGGQRQRLTIARAIIKSSPILILDDSSSALDFRTDALLRKALRRDLPEEVTIIIVSQRSSSIKDCDRIIVLDDGKIDSIGTHEQLLTTSTLYQEIYNSQVKSEEGEIL